MAKRKTTEERALEVLICARDLVAKPGGWIKHRLKHRRTKTEMEQGQAEYAYCVLGAIYKCSGRAGRTRSNYSAMATAIVEECIPAWSLSSISSFNDAQTTRQRDVVALFNRAIKRMEKEVAKQDAAAA